MEIRQTGLLYSKLFSFLLRITFSVDRSDLPSMVDFGGGGGGSF
uniref:Uncharacterized protein n=1 Tax=Anguilla anguilla TaxID=7936 RepID=A0A0E9QG80_ANGAN